MATESTKDGLQPGHDIFYTPDNTTSYATNSYTQLDSTQQEVRLLRLLPLSANNTIKCELLPKTPLLDVKDKYTALSYCAGSPRETEAILLNGTRCNVFASLGHAMKEIRNFWDKTYIDRECIVWIDQICINQNDIGERSHQVRFMREIYEYAEQVLVCLSTEKCDPKGMEWLLAIARYVAKDVPNRDLQNSEIDRLRSYLWASVKEQKFTEGWIAFYDVVDAPWWSRSWIFQEFIVAKSLQFMHSARFVSWGMFRFIVEGISFMHDLSLGGFSNNSSLTGEPSIQSLLRRIRRDETQRAISTMNFMSITKDNWSGTTDLMKLLDHSRYCQSSDPRDKVFAFLGMANPQYEILPDYTRTLAQVLTEASKRIIQYEDGLDILFHATASLSHRSNVTESWVVDWTSEKLAMISESFYVDPADLMRHHGLSRKHANAGFHLVDTPSGPRNALQLRGVAIADLATTRAFFLTWDLRPHYPVCLKPLNISPLYVSGVLKWVTKCGL